MEHILVFLWRKEEKTRKYISMGLFFISPTYLYNFMVVKRASLWDTCMISRILLVAIGLGHTPKYRYAFLRLPLFPYTYVVDWAIYI